MAIFEMNTNDLTVKTTDLANVKVVAMSDQNNSAAVKSIIAAAMKWKRLSYSQQYRLTTVKNVCDKLFCNSLVSVEIGESNSFYDLHGLYKSKYEALLEEADMTSGDMDIVARIRDEFGYLFFADLAIQIDNSYYSHLSVN